ncbi:TIR domain-containing protein [Clostridium hydrogenum]|uniref:TIR domain-containing protein n=1 Tax=Clostridium hydrogenum TaxID=2855764 RepID=UPI001F2F5100|nr:molecular chaperone Tir [Clostridium hydrogenum]
MTYRTKTYIAGDWTGDKDAVDKLYQWNESKHWSLSFTDAHELTQARDGSLNCSIKASLAKRFDVSKTFVLIVGENTNTVRSGACQYCNSYNSWNQSCARGKSVDYRSYIEYECEKAVRDGLKIVVLYNAATVNKTKCPEVVKNTGTHTAMCYRENGQLYWDYPAVKNAIG